MVLEITYTEPGLQGDRSTGGTKPATLETGAEIQVPLFLETGTRSRSTPATARYLGRVKLAVRTARSKARKRAIDLLFEAEQRGSTPRPARRAAGQAGPDASLNQYTADLVEGVVAHWTASTAARRPTPGLAARADARVDRAILRLGAFEVLYGEGVPRAWRSPRPSSSRRPDHRRLPEFVNGLLARLAAGQADPGVSARRLHTGTRPGRSPGGSSRRVRTVGPTGDGGGAVRCRPARRGLSAVR